MMRGLLVVVLLAQAVLPGGSEYVPKRPPTKAEGELGALIAETFAQAPAGEWITVKMILRRTQDDPQRFEIDYLHGSVPGSRYSARP